jgi:hypothetical protein
MHADKNGVSSDFQEASITMDEYDLGGITEERLSRLNAEQRKIVEKRQAKLNEMDKLIDMLADNADPDVHERVQNALRAIELPDRCDHNVSMFDDCDACDEIDRILFPELYDANGIRIE